jgi:hypothetical protein
MKTIKIKICGFDPKVEVSFGHFFLKYLNKYYNVEHSNDPDYVFYYERDSEHLKYPKAIRIFYTGENIHPDFNICDYAISFDRLEFGDRHFRLPLYMVATLYNKEDIEIAGDLTFENISPMTINELHAKKGFCSFGYSNYLADPRRKELFDAISTYKRVNACGEYLNNMDGWTTRRLSFKREHKFSIACENSSRIGYLTEKLPVGFAARTIPIYYGDPAVGLEFNTKRFINAHDFPSLAAVVERVKEIDQNDDLYLQIVNEPVLAEGFHYADTLSAFDNFLRNIFDQPLETARRRTINAVHADLLEKREKHFFRSRALAEKIRKFTAPLRRITILKKLKERIRKRRIYS